jgi:hypothetical protein
MARAWQEHGKRMAITWQEHGKNMARAWQYHGKNMPRPCQEHGSMVVVVVGVGVEEQGKNTDKARQEHHGKINQGKNVAIAWQ